MPNNAPAARAAILRKVIADAKAAGEKIPPGIRLLGTRGPTKAERAIGAALEPLAQKCLARGRLARAAKG